MRNSPSSLLLISVQVSISWSSSDLVPGVAQGLPAAARLQRLGTRGQTHTAVSVSPRAGKQHGSNRLIRTFLKEGCAMLCHPLPSALLPFCPSLWILLIKFLYPRSCGSSPHSSLPVIVTFCPSAFKWSETCFQLLINSILLRSLPSLFQSLLFALAFPWSYSFFIHLSVVSILPFLKDLVSLHILPKPALKKNAKNH